MRFIGYISREMIHKQILNMMGPCSTKVTLPLTGLDAMDLYTMVYLNDDTQTVVLESLKAKRQRYNGLYGKFQKEDYVNLPIINV